MKDRLPPPLPPRMFRCSSRPRHSMSSKINASARKPRKKTTKNVRDRSFIKPIEGRQESLFDTNSPQSADPS